MTDRLDFRGRDVCPFCGGAVPTNPAESFGDVVCPNCGQALFFVRMGREIVCYGGPVAGRLRERLVNLFASQLGVDQARVTPQTSFVDDLGADSLDLVELVMELEEESDLD